MESSASRALWEGHLALVALESKGDGGRSRIGPGVARLGYLFGAPARSGRASLGIFAVHVLIAEMMEPWGGYCDAVFGRANAKGTDQVDHCR